MRKKTKPLKLKVTVDASIYRSPCEMGRSDLLQLKKSDMAV